jgi:hypothetical protein
VRIVLGLGAALLLLLAVVVGTTWLSDEDSPPDVAGVSLAAADGSSVRGLGFFEQDGEQMTGFVVVWGLEPNSEHAVHFHGPDSSCGAKADPVAVHPDLKADDKGIAYTNVELSAEQHLLSGGFYYNVHAGPSREAENPEIACGDIEAGSTPATAGSMR